MWRWFALFGVVLLLACGRETPEAAVKKAFQACVDAVEKGQVDGVMERLHPSFRGPEGLEHAQARFFLMGIFRQQKVGVTVFSSAVEVRGSGATQVVEVMLTGRSGGALLPDDTSRKRFRLHWQRKDKEWLLQELGEA